MSATITSQKMIANQVSTTLTAKKFDDAGKNLIRRNKTIFQPHDTPSLRGASVAAMSNTDKQLQQPCECGTFSTETTP
jgi:hypothetical protein